MISRFVWNIKEIFKQLIIKLKERGFIIVWIHERSINSTELSLYSWMLKGQDADRINRTSSERYNVIAAQWNIEA